MNLPNKITLSRIILIPFVIFFYLATFIPYGKLIALILFIIASFTDALDGYIARKYNLITDLGKLLDPIADKVLVSSSLLLIITDGTIASPYGVIAGIIIIGREFIVSALRQIAASKNYVMAADKLGKLKTIFQDITLPLFLFISFINAENVLQNEVFVNVISIIAYTTLGIATALTIVSCINYLVKNREVLK